jgi:hypothetical protein
MRRAAASLFLSRVVVLSFVPRVVIFLFELKMGFFRPPAA